MGMFIQMIFIAQFPDCYARVLGICEALEATLAGDGSLSWYVLGKPWVLELHAD
jgi:hypothetical protein